jgi:hypothetical protein
MGLTAPSYVRNLRGEAVVRRLNLTSADAGAVRIKSLAPGRVLAMRWLHGSRFDRLAEKFEQPYRSPKRRGTRWPDRPFEVRLRNALTYIFADPLSWRVVARHLGVPLATLQGDVAEFEQARNLLGRDLADKGSVTPALLLKYLTVPQAKRRAQAEARKARFVTKLNTAPPRSAQRKMGILRKIDRQVELLDVEAEKQERRWRVKAGKLLDAGGSWDDVATKYGMTVPEARRRLEPSLGKDPPAWTHEEWARIRLEKYPEISLVELLRDARQLATPAPHEELAIVLQMPVVSVNRLLKSLGIEARPRTPRPPRTPGEATRHKGIRERPAELTERLLETLDERNDRLNRQWCEPYDVPLSMARLWDDAGYPAMDFGLWAAIPLRPGHLEWIRENRPDLDDPDYVFLDELNFPKALGTPTAP